MAIVSGGVGRVRPVDQMSVSTLLKNNKQAGRFMSWSGFPGELRRSRGLPRGLRYGRFELQEGSDGLTRRSRLSLA
jgi:hypothetical protein